MSKSGRKRIEVDRNRGCAICKRLLVQKVGESNTDFRDRVTCGIRTPCFATYMRELSKKHDYTYLRTRYSALGLERVPRQVRPYPPGVHFTDSLVARRDMGSPRAAMPVGGQHYASHTGSSAALAAEGLDYAVSNRPGSPFIT